MRRVVLPTVLMLACTERPAADELTEETGETASASDTTGEDTDELGCDPSECMQTCTQMEDLCGEPLGGTCSDADLCECEQTSDCQPCQSETCSPWQVCYEPHSLGGECNLSCFYELQYAWDPPGIGCVIGLPAELPITALHADHHFYLEIDGNMMPRAEGCTIPDGWILDTPNHHLVLCPEACTLFEAAGELFTGWGKNLPCE